MYTLTSTAGAIFQHSSDKAIIALTFPAAAILALGTPVKLNSDGTVSAVTAVTDVVLGYVYVSNTEAGGDVTVNTRFSMIVRGQANGAVATAALLDTVGVDATSKLGDYITHNGTTGNKVGQAIVGGADNAEIQVGLYF